MRAFYLETGDNGEVDVAIDHNAVSVADTGQGLQ